MTSNEWTVETLKEHFDVILSEHASAHKAEHVASENAITAAFTSAGTAINKTEATLAARFEAVNEFRSSLDDYVRGLVPRKEYEAGEDRLRALELAGPTYFTNKAFDRYVERVDEIRREDRRQRLTVSVAVTLALFGNFVAIALTLARR